MEIAEIKQQLTIGQVLDHYGLQPNKNRMLCCPFHADKTPSMQVYSDTNTVFCFSSNCELNGKAIDVIDFIFHQEKCTKHEAINKAKALLGHQSNQQSEAQQLSRIAVLTKLFGYFKNAVSSSKPAKGYLENRSLDFTKIEVGYNSGQFHHGSRKDQALIESCVKYGLLLNKGRTSRTGDLAYQPFGKNCIVFALRNQQNQVAGLYFRSTIDNQNSRHFYLKDRQGLYPGYPKKETKKLILTESIIDAASLLQQPEITKEYTVMALYGTNGLTEEHTGAISQLKDLQEIIFFLNGDAPGKEAVKKYASLFRDLLSEVKLTNAEPPENEDVNSLLQGHEPGILDYYIRERKPLLPRPSVRDVPFSNEITPTETEMITKFPPERMKN